MRYKPQQQQVGAARDGQRNCGRIEDRNKEEAQRSQVREPVRQHRMMGRRHWRFWRLTDEEAHFVLTALSLLEASAVRLWTLSAARGVANSRLFPWQAKEVVSVANFLEFIVRVRPEC